MDSSFPLFSRSPGWHNLSWVLIGDAVALSPYMEVATGWRCQHIWFLFFLETGAYFDKNGTQPGEIAFTSVLLVVIAWFTVRAARSATLLTNDAEVTVRGIYRARSWSWDEVDGFVADTKLIGPYVKYRRRVLGMRYRDGTIRWFTELSCRPAQGDGRSRIDDAADTLNHYLSSGQSRSAASLPRPT